MGRVVQFPNKESEQHKAARLADEAARLKLAAHLAEVQRRLKEAEVTHARLEREYRKAYIDMSRAVSSLVWRLVVLILLIALIIH